MIHAILVVAFIGFIVWAITALLPMPAPFKQVIVGLACLIALVVVLQAVGVDTGFRLN